MEIFDIFSVLAVDGNSMVHRAAAAGVRLPPGFSASHKSERGRKRHATDSAANENLKKASKKVSQCSSYLVINCEYI